MRIVHQDSEKRTATFARLLGISLILSSPAERIQDTVTVIIRR
jgi:hypothetical protein